MKPHFREPHGSKDTWRSSALILADRSNYGDSPGPRHAPGSWPVRVMLQGASTGCVMRVWFLLFLFSQEAERSLNFSTALSAHPLKHLTGGTPIRPDHPPKFRKLTKHDGSLEDEKEGPHWEGVLSHMPGWATIGPLGIHITPSMPECSLPGSTPTPSQAHTASSTPSGPGLLQPLQSTWLPRQPLTRFPCGPPAYLGDGGWMGLSVASPLIIKSPSQVRLPPCPTVLMAFRVACSCATVPDPSPTGLKGNS